jgi:hypothetical protein
MLMDFFQDSLVSVGVEVHVDPNSTIACVIRSFGLAKT